MKGPELFRCAPAESKIVVSGFTIVNDGVQCRGECNPRVVTTLSLDWAVSTSVQGAFWFSGVTWAMRVTRALGNWIWWIGSVVTGVLERVAVLELLIPRPKNRSLQ